MVVKIFKSLTSNASILGVGVLFLLHCLSSPDACHADTDEFDRPGLTEHSFTMNQGEIAVEAGFEQSHNRQPDGNVENYSFPALIRYGLSKDFELRAEGDIASLNRSSSETEEDSSSLTTDTVGFKYHLFQDELHASRFSLGVLGRVAPPGGEDDSLAQKVTGDLRLAADVNLGDDLTANVNVGGGMYENQQHKGFGSGISSFSIENEINNDTSVYGEVAYQSLETAKGEDPALYLDFGGSYKVTENLQLDLSVGSGAGGRHPENMFWTAGISIRF